ncbi:hypothetical protein N8912_05355 [Rhodobacteraceae bacterium]|nr:hypothetical protein [Paracoccaceae bacterium]
MKPAAAVSGVRATLRARHGTWMCLKGRLSGVALAPADSSNWALAPPFGSREMETRLCGPQRDA